MRFALLFLCACSGPSQEITDAGADAYGHKTFPEASVEAGPVPLDCDAGNTPSTTYPAPHPKMPLATTHGGPVLTTPRFVPIVFAAEDRTKDIGAFMKIAGASTWWSLASQYGVGPATGGDPIVVQETPPTSLTDGDVRAWLADKLDGSHADFGAPDTNAIYIVYYPAATTIYESTLGKSCVLFGGYHSETNIGGKKIVYSVIARCGQQAVTSITSHELFEAATDPYISTATAWMGVDDTMEMPFGFGTELGDLCENGDAEVTPNDIGYPVQRMWSNAAAAAGRDPCQPEPAPYFRTVTTVNQISLAPGASTTVDLVAFSDQDTGGPWSVTVTSSWGQIEDKLDLQLCRTSVQNGEHVPLAITRDAWAKQTSTVQITSNLGNVTTYWTLDVGF